MGLGSAPSDEGNLALELVRWRGSQLNSLHWRKIAVFLLCIKNTAINTAKSFSEGIFVVCVSTSLTNAHDGLTASAKLPRQCSNCLTLSQTCHHGLDCSFTKALGSAKRFAL
jgi:hypothetical protein